MTPMTWISYTILMSLINGTSMSGNFQMNSVIFFVFNIVSIYLQCNRTLRRQSCSSARDRAGGTGNVDYY